MTAHANRRVAQSLRWGGFTLVLFAMLAGAANLVFAPWGNDPDGLVFGTRGLGYVDGSSFTFREMDPISRYYFSGGGAVLVGAAGALAIVAGVRAGWSRGIGAGLAAVVTLLLLAAAWGRYVSADDSFLDSADATDLRIAAAVLLGLAVLAAAVVVALLFGVRHFYGGVAVAAPLALAVLHLWSMYALTQFPGSGLRLIVPAWTPAGWYALAAVGALLATIGDTLRRREPAASPSQAPWPDPRYPVAPR